MSKDTIDYDSEEQINIFKEILKTPSENPGDYEEGVAKVISDILKQEGIESRLVPIDDNRVNLYATLESGVNGNHLLFNGHLDTVPTGDGWSVDPFGGEEVDGYIYGRGASDMKAGVASMVYAAICLKRAGYPKTGKLTLFFNADEERINLGMKQFLQENLEADYAIISEPTDLDIAIGHRGVARFYLKTQGEAGHSCYVKKPINAIEKMSGILPGLFQYTESIRKEKNDDFLGHAISNITTINGGVAGNIIPDECVVEIDRRTLPGETIEDIEEEYHQVIRNWNSTIPYELERYTFLPASLISSDHPFVETLQEKANRHVENSNIKSFEATCEAPFFSVEKGIPTIIFGPGSISEAHVTNEKVAKEEIIQASHIFIDLCEEILA
ncbi:M20 family metallopeptidase [Alkalibacillus haloalkaliphilus]|uniref:M20 family metallopeptidase n=1 Tax=Alkalibacillus haloalkaliphilus TaxID=94136 RepID=UPI000302A063|nr:M20 family metallopeptidase [Alkalibacillus haloalkaliphilus]